MALTNQPQAVQYIHRVGGGTAPIMHGGETASSSWKAGAFLQDDAAGLLKLCASPIDASGETKRAFGFALADASGTTGKDAPYLWLGDAALVFEGTLSDPAGTHTLVIADLFSIYPITLDATFSSGHWYLNGNTVDAEGGLIIGFKDPVGTVDARVYFIVTSTARGAEQGSSGVI